MNKGFTLIEVLVAMVIMTFVVGSAYTMFNSGVVFTSKHSTQVDLRNDARHLFNDIVKMIQETDPNTFPSYQAYVEKGFLTGTATITPNQASSNQISFQNQSDVITYWYVAPEKKIYKRKNSETPHTLLENVDTFEILFNKQNETLEYTINSTIQYRNETVVVQVQAVPRIPFRYPASISVWGPSQINIPASGEPVNSATYIAYVLDQFGSELEISASDLTWIYNSSHTGITITVNTQGELVISVSNTAQPVASLPITVQTHSNTGLIQATMDVRIAAPSDPSAPPLMFNRLNTWKSQGNNKQWNIAYSPDDSIITVSQKTNSDHFTIYDQVLGNFDYEVDVNLTGKMDTNHISKYGITFGPDNTVNKNKIDNNYFYVQINGSRQMQLRYKSSSGTDIAIPNVTLPTYNNVSYTAKLNVALQGTTLSFYFNGNSTPTYTTTYNNQMNYLGIGEESRSKAPSATYTVYNKELSFTQ